MIIILIISCRTVTELLFVLTRSRHGLLYFRFTVAPTKTKMAASWCEPCIYCSTENSVMSEETLSVVKVLVLGFGVIGDVISSSCAAVINNYNCNNVNANIINNSQRLQFTTKLKLCNSHLYRKPSYILNGKSKRRSKAIYYSLSQRVTYLCKRVLNDPKVRLVTCFHDGLSR